MKKEVNTLDYDSTKLEIAKKMVSDKKIWG